MSDSQWAKQGGTCSHKNACKEVGLAEDEIIKAMKAGKLQCRQNHAHGNPYFRVLRKEIEALAKELYGNKSVEEQEVKFKLQIFFAPDAKKPAPLKKALYCKGT